MRRDGEVPGSAHPFERFCLEVLRGLARAGGCCLLVSVFAGNLASQSISEETQLTSNERMSASGQQVSDVLPSSEEKRVAKGEKKPPKTQITGRRMNLIRKGEAIEFVGAVKMVRGNDFLSADRMVSEEKIGLVRAWGDVYLRRDVPQENVRWEAWGEEGAYEEDSSSGTLIGKKKPARVRRSFLDKRPEEEKFDMEADVVTFYESVLPVAPKIDKSTFSAKLSVDSGMAEGHGRVYMKFEEPGPPLRETEVWSGKAFYDGPSGSLSFREGYGKEGPGEMVGAELTSDEKEFFASSAGMPVARQTGEGEIRDLTGETVKYFLNEKRLLVEDNVKALLLSTQGKN